MTDPGPGLSASEAPPLIAPRAAAHPVWARVRRAAVWLFFGLIAWLLIDRARAIEWTQVAQAVLEIPWPVMLLALLLAAASHVLYSTYDLLGRHMTGHPLGTRTVMGVTFISYAFNLNLGSLLGGGGSRFRLYSQFGLDSETITRVWAFSMVTNWLGYLAVGGAAFFFGGMQLPPDWKIDSGGLRILGAVLMGLAAAYLLLCAVARQHVWRFRGHALRTPTLRMGLVQLAMSSLNWSIMGVIVWVLLRQQVGYPYVLAVLLVAAVAGVLVHVPGNLGVMEAVFIALMAFRIDEPTLLAALLAYRAVYYLLPLLVATKMYVVTELRVRRRRRRLLRH